MTAFSGPVIHTDRSAASGRAWFSAQPIGCDPDFIVFWDDFTGVAVDSTNDWTVVKDAGAAVTIAADTVGGELLLTSAATTDNDGASVQGNEIFKAASGKNIWFEARVKVADADQQDVYVGLTVNFATNPEAVLTAADRIGFQIDDDNASILCKTEAGGTETSTDSGVDAADDTYVTLGIMVRGTTAVEFYINRALVATHTTNITTTELTPALFSLSGNGTGTKVLTADYVYVAANR